MIRSTLTAITMASLLSVSSAAVFAQTAGTGAPVDKGGAPPSTEMEAGSGSGNALPPGSIDSGNSGDASGSSTSPGTGSGSMSGGSSMGSGSGSGSGDSGKAGMSNGGKGSSGTPAGSKDGAGG
ncbi:hypothetical protein PS645_04837 [Pseudomonas fluorescens]|uniref:Uncharacterized protein n=1 Tax=Pseudomonas fluorescens TaxID=294 RepID=A0A5E6WPT3_PSEFL|nr:hypothetical protein PS645_04837 [Pseudomonas fluorescens]